MHYMARYNLGVIDLMDTKMSVSRQWKGKSGKIYFLIC